jgi:large subunit ribosomal protein L4e
MSQKLTIYSLDGKAGSQQQLPVQFNEPVRTDLIKKAVLVLQANARQPYGADPEAGKKHSVYVSRRRRDYRGSYGQGISRVPRKVMSRRGTRMNWVGAFAPGTTGGRRAHPPKAEKQWELSMNKKENRKAIRSAMSATVQKDLVLSRGHKAPDNYPFMVSDAFEQINKTAELVKALEALGLAAELARAENPRKRGGVAKLRGRGSTQRTSLLIVTSSDAPVMMAAQNIPGVQAASVNELNAELLAPGTHPGRLTLYTESAIKALEEKRLFL